METVEEFLNKCRQSGDAAYSALRSVLEKLENPKTRVDARIFMSMLQKHFDSAAVSSDDFFATYHFKINDIQLEHSSGFPQRKKLTMLVIPSIFMPEDWSFTFYEGLNRHPESIYKDKVVAELGCGNGWITIAIAEKWSPSKVYGLDINPRAVKVSWINLYLNALDENGKPIYDGEKKTLLDRVEFHESDLLAYCKDHNIMLERIVGCIPQILNPNPDAMTKMITENASEEFLYSLSNYCALQGFVEDQFGLGLIARAIEEGISVIKPTGIMIFNMGGRPGQAVCRRLFERRGFRVNKIWQTKVIQAADTDISALVEIEKNSPHRFEFFMGRTGDRPLCARTAWAYGKAGGCISHSISVYSCQLRQPNQVKTIFDFLRDGFKEINNSLDLSFDDDAVADEKIPFLSYLASVLKEHSYLPFESPAGSKRFRDLVAGFIKTYHHVPLTSKNVVVFPSRTAAIENALRLFSPNLAIVDEHLTRDLPRQWMTSLAIEKRDCSETSDMVTVIEAPRQSDLMVELIKKLKPQVVVTGIASFEAVTSAAFENLLNVTREIGSRLFLDISDHFELSSLPSSNGVLKYLAGNSLPSHVAIVCGLLKNQVYKDLEVAFVISEDEAIFRALARTVELLEGNTSLISQNYYGCLFNELLSFQLADRHPPAMREFDKKSTTKLIGFASSAVSVFNNSELSISEDDKKYSLIHMDVDQSFLSMPSPVKAAIFESFARQNLSESETDVTNGIRQFIKTRYGFPTNNSTEFLYSDYSLGLFNKLLLSCIQESGTLCFPAGCNGNYIAAAKFMKANIVNIPTQADVGFKLTASVLTKVLESVEKPWLYISGPTINPTGLLYSNEEMEDILSVCVKFGARVLIDTSFSGLEYDIKNWDAWNLEPTLAKFYSSHNSTFCVSLLGSLSLEMLTGGLTFAFLAVDRSLLTETTNGFAGLTKPHSTTRYAMKKLLAQTEQEAGNLSESVAEHKGILKKRSQRLRETLQNCGWEVLPSQGGVSMVARPSNYIGKHDKLENDDSQKTELGDSTIREAILVATGLCINSGSWTGIPGYCRFTIALQEDEFEQALDRIAKFKDFIA
ncbi:methionine S-methyltransferase-like [Chenopodium quinoa]|uniref:methionine S-methyltransferase-like n=1 Tax=Chenopodium quinoa TaxID=63459 RepID=UPI000B7722BD|nr:methionine S-methyltransferase-like [Chenopodium quinoa]